MEKTFEFEINFELNGQLHKMSTSMSALDIVDAIFKAMDIYRNDFGITLTSDNFILIGEYNA